MQSTPNLIAKELSWLEFKDRILQVAADSRNLVIERLRFLGIFSNNQDEFFKVRVAEIRRNGILEKATSNTQELRKADTVNYAIIDVPEAVLRFLQIPSDRTQHHKYFMVVDEIIRYCHKQIFSGFFEYDSLQAWSMKFSRDAEYRLEEDVELSLIEKLSLGMKQQLTAEPVCLGHDRKMPQEIVKLLCKKLGFEDLDSVIPGGRYRNFRDFIGFRNPSTRYLENPTLAVVTRMEEGVERKYAVIGTSNFNKNTAKIYTDFALFTCHAEICEEADSVFSFIQRPCRQPLLQHLLVSPMHTRSVFKSLIRKEAKNALARKEAKILIKIKNLMDKDLIHLLSEASRAGVSIQILVRALRSPIAIHDYVCTLENT
jgi:polyphosphate kinase